MTPLALLLAQACGRPSPETRPRERGERPERVFGSDRAERPSRVDERYPAEPTRQDGVLRAAVADDGDDGVHAADGWSTDGAGDLLVAKAGTTVALRFTLPSPLPAAPVQARLSLPLGAGVNGSHLRIRAVADDGGPLEGVTGSGPVVDWTLPQPMIDGWASAPERKDNVARWCAPFLRDTPDLSALLAPLAGATRVVVLLEGAEGGGDWPIVDRQEIEDPECPGVLSARLSVYPTVRSALVAREMLGRPTDDGVTVSAMSLVDGEVQVVVGAVGAEPVTVGPLPMTAGRPFQVPLVVGEDTSARYHLDVRRSPDDPWDVGPSHEFHTRRPPGRPFSFTVTADGHFINMENRRAYAHMTLLERTMSAIGRDHPDFHLDLGDTFNGESYRSFDATDDEEMARRHLEVRPWFEIVGAGAPVLMALGNHEGEQGWRLAANDPVPALSARWRRALFPNPPGGNEEADDAGPLEDYWSMTWGDVLVVVLDPFRYTVRKPHDLDGTPGSGDRWDWTLGEAQEAWLRRTLQESDAPFKLVFSHQAVGGNSDYGRGGRPHRETGSYEMGGTGADGRPAFAERRPGWPQPLHDLMRDAHVTAFVHGHDHVFVWEEPLEGVAYVTAPQPGDADYDKGHATRSGYDPEAKIVGNSGYLLFETTREGKLRLSYVRVRLPGDGVPHQTAFEHTFDRP